MSDALVSGSRLVVPDGVVKQPLGQCNCREQVEHVPM
jgi:hypothetical protein